MARAKGAADVAEAKAQAADARRQELGPNDARLHRQSPGIVQAVHPDSGADVTFVPGEALPGWAAALIDRADVDEDTGVITLVTR